LTGNRLMEKIIDTLNAGDPVFEKAGNNRWKFSLNHGCLLNGTINNEDGWFLLDAGLPTGSFDRFSLIDKLTDLLLLNMGLPDNVKWILTPGGIPRLRAEIPVRKNIRDESRFLEIIEGLQSGWKQYREGFNAKSESLSSDKQESVSGDVRDYLKQACVEKGWHVSERTGGEIYVNLDVPGVFQQASFSASGGQIYINATFGEWGDCGVTSLKALSSILLVVGGFVRRVRPSAFRNEECDSHIPLLQVALYESPPAEEISGALSALWVACNLCARELPLMRNEVTAGEYIAIRHSKCR